MNKQQLIIKAQSQIARIISTIQAEREVGEWDKERGVKRSSDGRFASKGENSTSKNGGEELRSTSPESFSSKYIIPITKNLDKTKEAVNKKISSFKEMSAEANDAINELLQKPVTEKQIIQRADLLLGRAVDGASKRATEIFDLVTHPDPKKKIHGLEKIIDTLSVTGSGVAMALTTPEERTGNRNSLMQVAALAESVVLAGAAIASAITLARATKSIGYAYKLTKTVQGADEAMMIAAKGGIISLLETLFLSHEYLKTIEIQEKLEVERMKPKEKVENFISSGQKILTQIKKEIEAEINTYKKKIL